MGKSECWSASVRWGCGACNFWAPPLSFPADNMAFHQGVARISDRMWDIHPAGKAAVTESLPFPNTSFSGSPTASRARAKLISVASEALTSDHFFCALPWTMTTVCVHVLNLYLRMCVCSVTLVTSVMLDSLWPYRLSPAGSSVHGVLQARILEWVAMPSSRGSSRPKDWSCISCHYRQILYLWATREAQQTSRRFPISLHVFKSPRLAHAFPSALLHPSTSSPSRLNSNITSSIKPSLLTFPALWCFVSNCALITPCWNYTSSNL